MRTVLTLLTAAAIFGGMASAAWAEDDATAKPATDAKKVDAKAQAAEMAKLRVKMHRTLADLIEAQNVEEPDQAKIEKLTNDLEEVRKELWAQRSSFPGRPFAGPQGGQPGPFCPRGGPGMGPGQGRGRGPGGQKGFGPGQGPGPGAGAGMGPPGQGRGRSPGGQQGMGRGMGFRAMGPGGGRGMPWGAPQGVGPDQGDNRPPGFGPGRGPGPGAGQGMGPGPGWGRGRGPGAGGFGPGRGPGRGPGAGWGPGFIDRDQDGVCDRVEPPETQEPQE